MDNNITKETGKLFGALWSPFDDKSFEFSVGLFRKRFLANNFDLSWFKNKKCLDAGCGGGRYCIAMAREGAKEVIGIDVGSKGIVDAKNRAKEYANVTFQEASLLELPFKDNTFDFVFSSGVIHHTENPEKGFQEVCRVLKPGGKIYLLLYAHGGIRWPAIMEYRKCLKDIPEKLMKKIMLDSGFPANKIRTLIDDLKVPLIKFYTFEYICQQLEKNGITNIERWEKGRFDHEENLKEMRNDMEWFLKFFSAGKDQKEFQTEFIKASNIASGYIKTMKHLEDQVENNVLEKTDVERIIIGQGHHRLIAEKI